MLHTGMNAYSGSHDVIGGGTSLVVAAILLLITVIYIAAGRG